VSLKKTFFFFAFQKWHFILFACFSSPCLLNSSQATIFDLPSEVLDGIFSQLDLKDLKVLTETCTWFNKIVGSSACLMESFEVKWKRETHQNPDIILLIDSPRQYQALDICGIEGMNPFLSVFIKTHSSSLTYVHIGYGSINMTDLIAMLQTLAHNLKVLKITPTALNNDVDVVTAINFPSLVKLMITEPYRKLPWISLSKLFQRARNIEVSLLYNKFSQSHLTNHIFAGTRT
jgi:hypothetical protein